MSPLEHHQLENARVFATGLACEDDIMNRSGVDVDVFKEFQSVVGILLAIEDNGEVLVTGHFQEGDGGHGETAHAGGKRVSLADECGGGFVACFHAVIERLVRS